MMNPDTQNRPLDPIEAALQTYPLASAPAALRSRVMQRVRNLPVIPPFSFPWLEAAVSLMVTSMLTVFAYLAISFTPRNFLLIQQNLNRLFVNPANRPITLTVVAGLGMALVLIFAAALIFAPARPARGNIERRTG